MLEIKQQAVGRWIRSTMGDEAMTVRERLLRIIEEAIELGREYVTVEDIIKIVNREYDKEPGDPFQELGGLMVTILGYCDLVKVDPEFALDMEMARIHLPENIEKVREKQKMKKAMGL